MTGVWACGRGGVLVWVWADVSFQFDFFFLGKNNVRRGYCCLYRSLRARCKGVKKTLVLGVPGYYFRRALQEEIDSDCNAQKKRLKRKFSSSADLKDFES